MDAPARQSVTGDNRPAFGATLALERQILTASLSFLFTLASLTTVRPTAVAKAAHNPCEEIQVLQGVQDTIALVGKVFFYPISPFAFQGKVTHLKVTLASGSALPKWLEYNPNTRTLQGLPMSEERGEYRLTVVAYGEACGPRIPTTGANFALHVQDYVFVHKKKLGQDQKNVPNIVYSGGLRTRKLSVTFAELIIRHTSPLEIQERLDLICTMADLLRVDPSLLTLTPFEDPFKRCLWNLTTLAEDFRYVHTTKNHYVGIYWPVGFGVFAMFYELVQVLRHTIESNHLSQLLGYEIAGWRILRQESHEKKYSGKRLRRQLMATPSLTLRPTKTEGFPGLPATPLHTKSGVRARSSPLYEVTRTATPTYTDNFEHSVTSEENLEALDMQTLLNVQTKTPTPTTLQGLSSAFPELLPSLMTSTELEDKESSRTLPISQQLQSQVQQEVAYSLPKKSESKHHFILHYFGFSVPTSKTQFSRPSHLTMDTYLSPEVTPFSRTPLAHLGEIFTSLDHNGPYAEQLTASRLLLQDIISTAKAPVPVISTLVNQRASPERPLSGAVTSLPLSGSSCQSQDLLSNYQHASGGGYMSVPRIDSPLFTEENHSPLATTQTEIASWNMEFSFTGITLTPGSASASPAPAHKPGWPPDPSPLHYSDTLPAWAMYSTQEVNTSLFAHFLESGLLSRTSSTTAKLPSLPLSVLMDLTVGLSHMLPMEEFFSSRRQVSPEVFKIYENSSFMTIPETYGYLFTKDKTSAFTAALVVTPLWNKPSHLICVPATSAPVLSSGFLGESGLSHDTSWTPEWSSHGALVLSWPMEFADSLKSSLSTNEFGSDYSNAVRASVARPVHLDRSDLSLASSFGTKTNFQITTEFTSELTEESMISHKEIPSEPAFYATSLLHAAQGQTNTSPSIVNAIKWLTATIGHKFSFSIPPDTFYDQEDGNTTQLALGINPVDYSPTGLESWLQFNSCYQTMHGYPLDHDFQYSPQEFLLFATDSGGLRASDTLTIELRRPAVIPCHIYTIRTKNSYHSFLRNRKRVSLFFEKLSNYLSAGSSGSMTLLHLRPGSTVITWYDNSVCTRTNRCATDEIQGVLIKLGVPGRNVNPDFIEAMLPDYKIDQIEDVTYGGICSETAKPFNESLTSNRTLGTFKDSRSWIRNLFSALLISIIATVLLILIITFHYWKHHKKVSRLQSASFHARPIFSYVDFEMDMLRSRKPPVLEEEVPRAAQLWFHMPSSSQRHLCRPNRTLIASSLPPPPKYRLPPSYGMREPGQSCHDHGHKKSYPKARLC